MTEGIKPIEAAAIKALAEKRGLAINAFRPQSHQEPIFVQPRPRYMGVQGGNRGGKTISLMALGSGVAMDKQITFADGSKHECRMPWQKGRPVLIWIICIDQRHIGEVVYPALFKAGFFKRFQVVHDPITKEFRAYDHIKDAKLKPRQHPPFIPKQYVGSISWESKADKIFNSATIVEPGTDNVLAEIKCYTSKGDAPQGRVADLVYIEEQLAHQGYIGELMARIVDVSGQIVWSSWNADGGEDDDLARFNEMLDREIEANTGRAKRVILTMSGNKTFTKEMVEDFLAGCATEEERLQRDLGIRPSEKLRMYPLFDKEIHTALGHDDELARVLKRTDGIPPKTWTRTLILDPGTQHPGVLLCAVPPPELGDYFVPYQQIYPGRADPIQLAKIVAPEVRGWMFHNFIIDYRAGRAQSIGLSHRVVDAYRMAFKEEGLSCHLTKHGFTFASDDVGGRQLVLQSWMHPGKSGLPRLRVVTHRCPDLCEQLRKIKKDTVRKEVRDDRKLAGQASDLVDALEYYAASGPRYIRPVENPEDMPASWKRYTERMKKRDAGTSTACRVGTTY